MSSATVSMDVLTARMMTLTALWQTPRVEIHISKLRIRSVGTAPISALSETEKIGTLP